MIDQHVGADVEKHWLGALINDWRNAADEGERGAPDLVPRPYPAQSERDMQGRSSARKAHHIRDSYFTVDSRSSNAVSIGPIGANQFEAKTSRISSNSSPHLCGGDKNSRLLRRSRSFRAMGLSCQAMPDGFPEHTATSAVNPGSLPLFSSGHSLLSGEARWRQTTRGHAAKWSMGSRIF